MESVFIVTSGWYSDKTIEATFSTRERAEQFMENFHNDDTEVLEFQIDEFNPGRPELYYTQVVMERDGSLLREPETKIRTQDVAPGRMGPSLEFRIALGGDSGDYPFVLKTLSHTKDREAAIKRANEWRTQMEALELWPETPPGKRWGEDIMEAQQVYFENNRRLDDLLGR